MKKYQADFNHIKPIRVRIRKFLEFHLQININLAQLQYHQKMFSQQVPYYMPWFVDPAYSCYYPEYFRYYKSQTSDFNQTPQIKIEVPQTVEKKEKQEVLIDQKVKKIQKYGKKINNKVKVSPKQKKKKDDDFKHRIQTNNRNLKSNTLKLFFKYLWEPRSQTYAALNKIIHIHQLDYDIKQFLNQLKQVVGNQRNYISFNEVKKMCLKGSFGKILRISMRYFFYKGIFCVGMHSARTTRKIRLEQIKKGKQFLKSLNFQ